MCNTPEVLYHVSKILCSHDMIQYCDTASFHDKKNILIIAWWLIYLHAAVTDSWCITFFENKLKHSKSKQSAFIAKLNKLC